MTEQTVFEQMIKENPRDFTTRKVYADWLDENDMPEEADKQRGWNDSKQDSWEWLEDFADKGGVTWIRDESPYSTREITIQDLLDAGYGWVRDGQSWTQEGDEELQAMMYGNDKEDFWRHWSNVTGVQIDDDIMSDNPFRCSC